MARTTRSHLPGGIFHLTSRTLGRRARFTEPLRSMIVDEMAIIFERSDALLLAYAIMPNHLHLVVRQGDARLAELMQPLLRRVALRVHKVHRTAGHVFERRFRDHICADPYHARNAIIYTHFNPVRSGIVDRPGSYAWSSHGLYSGDDAARRPIGRVLATHVGLSLFAPRAGVPTAMLRRSYARCVEWRRVRDSYDDLPSHQRESSEPPEPPQLLGGGTPWSGAFPGLFGGYHGRRRPPWERRPLRMDLSDIAKRSLADLAPELELALIRSPYKGRRVVAIRREVIGRMRDAGHANRAIAQYMGVSDQTVSDALAARRLSAGARGR